MIKLKDVGSLFFELWSISILTAVRSKCLKVKAWKKLDVCILAPFELLKHASLSSECLFACLMIFSPPKMPQIGSRGLPQECLFLHWFRDIFILPIKFSGGHRLRSELFKTWANAVMGRPFISQNTCWPLGRSCCKQTRIHVADPSNAVKELWWWWWWLIEWWKTYMV